VETWDLDDALGAISHLDVLDAGAYDSSDVNELVAHLRQRWNSFGTHLKVGVARTFERKGHLGTDSVYGGFNSGHHVDGNDQIVTVIMLTTPVEEAGQDDFLLAATEAVKGEKLSKLEAELKRAEEAAARNNAEVDRLKAKLAGSK
jgi:hypothetical protein